MFTLIFTIIYITFLIGFIIKLLLKVNSLEEDNLIMSCEINKLVKENSRLRKENEDVLPIKRERTRNNKKSTKLYHH